MRHTDREPDYVELEETDIRAVTAKAILVFHDGDEVWVPKSVVEDPEQYEKGDSGVTVNVQEWFARRKALI